MRQGGAAAKLTQGQSIADAGLLHVARPGASTFGVPTLSR